MDKNLSQTEIDTIVESLEFFMRAEFNAGNDSTFVYLARIRAKFTDRPFERIHPILQEKL